VRVESGRVGSRFAGAGDNVRAVEDEEEARFVARLVARDETAFNELVLLFERRVLALTLRMLGRKADAEEVTQDVFVQVFRNIDAFRGDSKLSTWIFRVAVNLCKNRMKYDARRGGRRHDDVDALGEVRDFEGAVGVSVGAVHRPDAVAEERQLVELVRTAIESLDPAHRQLLILRDVEDLSYEEVAEVTGLSLGTVKSRIHRGRIELREKVERLLAARRSIKVNA
jgi:RNA polymerase sigma-70 factor (ECF subfamily)